MLSIPPTPLQLREKIWELLEPLLSHYDVTFSRAHPKAEVQKPTIVISVVNRTPGGKTKETFKPRLTNSTVTTDGDTIIQYFAQGFRITLRFDVYSTNAAECDAITDSLEDALHAIVPDIQGLGVQEFYFMDMHATNLIEATAAQLYNNSLVYAAILDRVYRRAVPMVTLIRLTADMGIKRLEDNPMVRSTSGNMDLLVYPDGSPITSVYRVEFAADNEGTVRTAVLRGMDELGFKIYVPGIDFVPYHDKETGRYFILWLDTGTSPPPGSTYYCTLSLYTERTEIGLY